MQVRHRGRARGNGPAGWVLTGLASCLLAAGCSAAAGTAGDSAGPISSSLPSPPTSTVANAASSSAATSAVASPSTATPTSSQRPQQTIEQVDLGSLSYVVGADRRSVALTGGTATDELGRITTLKNTVYADADGDGFPDAAVEIAVADGNGYEALWYIVLWDRATQSPVQFQDPFARTFRCGDVVDSVTAATRGFTVAEHRTEGELASCADQPPVAITRTVGIRDGWLAELSPAMGYGGICPHAIGDDGSHVPPGNLRIGPSADAPRIGDTAKGAWLLAPQDGADSGTPGWRLMGYSTTDTVESWYSACAWVEG